VLVSSKILDQNNTVLEGDSSGVFISVSPSFLSYFWPFVLGCKAQRPRSWLPCFHCPHQRLTCPSALCSQGRYKHLLQTIQIAWDLICPLKAPVHPVSGNAAKNGSIPRVGDIWVRLPINSIFFLVKKGGIRTDLWYSQSKYSQLVNMLLVFFVWFSF